MSKVAHCQMQDSDASQPGARPDQLGCMVVHCGNASRTSAIAADIVRCGAADLAARCAALANSSVMVTVADVRRVALSLPGTTEHLIRDRVKFRVKRLVYVAFSRDETLMGFGFPKEQRSALVESEPNKFLLPPVADMRYNWVDVKMAALDIEEMTELVTDAWTMVVPKYVAQEYFDALGT